VPLSSLREREFRFTTILIGPPFSQVYTFLSLVVVRSIVYFSSFFSLSIGGHRPRISSFLQRCTTELFLSGGRKIARRRTLPLLRPSPLILCIVGNLAFPDEQLTEFLPAPPDVFFHLPGSSSCPHVFIRYRCSPFFGTGFGGT